MHEMVSRALAGESDAARALDARLAGLHKALFIESSPIPVKWAVNRMGLSGKGIRLPLTWLSAAAEAEVAAAMQQAGIH